MGKRQRRRDREQTTDVDLLRDLHDELRDEIRDVYDQCEENKRPPKSLLFHMLVEKTVTAAHRLGLELDHGAFYREVVRLNNQMELGIEKVATWQR